MPVSKKKNVPTSTYKTMEDTTQRRSREFAQLVISLQSYFGSKRGLRKVVSEASGVLLGHLEAYPLPESPIPFPFRSPAEMAGWSDAQVLIEYLRVGAAWEHVSTKQQDLGAADTMARVRGALTWWCSEEGVEGWTAYMDAVGKKGWRKYYSGR